MMNQKMRTALMGLVGAVCVVTVSAQAGNLGTPFTLDSTGVLPRGIRSVRVLGFTTEIDDRWNGSGFSEPLAARMNRPLTYGELVEAQPQASDRAQLKGYLLSKDIAMDAVVGDSAGIVNARVTATVPVLAYGLTDRLTVAAIVPVLYSNVNIATGWTSNSNFQAVLDGLSAEGKHNKKLSFEDKLQNVVQTKVIGYGYQALEDESHQEIGDVSLGAKYLLYKDEKWSTVLSPRVVVPTGRTSSVEKLIDIAPGDGQWDVGLGVTTEYAFDGSVSALASVGALAQLPQHRARRIPIKRWESPTPDIDGDVAEDLGDIYSASVGAKLKAFELWTLGLQYGLQYKESDRYAGGRYSSERYSWMSDDTEQFLEALQAGLTFSTIPLFRSGQFAAPLETTLAVATVLSGRNAQQANLVSWDFAVFF